MSDKPIKKALQHFATITKHRWYVFIECCRLGIPWRGIVHDLSKFSPAEFVPSARYWTGKGSPIAAEAKTVGYSYAWRHHKGVNRHHWQWYVDFNDDLTLNPAPMPEKYIRELVADLKGAARAYGTNDARGYYLANRHKWCVHPDTSERIEELLVVAL